MGTNVCLLLLKINLLLTFKKKQMTFHILRKMSLFFSIQKEGWYSKKKQRRKITELTAGGTCQQGIGNAYSS